MRDKENGTPTGPQATIHPLPQPAQIMDTGTHAYMLRAVGP